MKRLCLISLRDMLRDRLDVVAALAGVLLGLTISFLNLVYSNEYMITLGPMLVIVCLGYLAFRHKLLAPSTNLEPNSYVVIASNIVFWLLLGGSLYSLTTEILHRPPIYFILTSAAASMIALQILYGREQRTTTYLVLLEVLLLSLSVRASAYFVFPTLPGSDPWAHLNYIEDFVNLGRIGSTRGDIYYLNYPIMHLNVVSAKLMTGVDYKMAMFLGIGIPLLLSLIFVFLIGRTVVNTKVGLLSALLVSLADYHVGYSVSLTATSFSIVLFSVIFWLLIQNRDKFRMLTAALAILLLLTLVVTHTASTFIAFCCLAFLLVGNRLYRLLHKEQRKSEYSVVAPTLLTMFGVSMIGYWMYAGYVEGRTFFESITYGLYRALTEQAGFLARPASLLTQYGYLQPILNIAGFLTLYLCGTLGSLLWLARPNQTKIKVALVTAVALLTAFTLSFPTFGMRNIVPYRWFAFIYVVLSVVAAAPVFAGIERIRNYRFAGTVMICFTFTISFLMITDSESNIDSPIYTAKLSQRMVYTTSEMAIANKVVEVYSGLIIADLQYGSRVLQTHLGRTEVSYNMPDERTLNNGLVIWRDVMAERPVQAPRVNIFLGQPFKLKLETSHNVIYSSNTAQAFIARGL